MRYSEGHLSLTRVHLRTSVHRSSSSIRVPCSKDILGSYLGAKEAKSYDTCKAYAYKCEEKCEDVEECKQICPDPILDRVCEPVCKVRAPSDVNRSLSRDQGFVVTRLLAPLLAPSSCKSSGRMTASAGSVGELARQSWCHDSM